MMTKTSKTTENLAEVLREACKATGKRPYKIAVGAGMTIPAMYLLMNGSDRMTLRNAGKLLHYLGYKLVKDREA